MTSDDTASTCERSPYDTAQTPARHLCRRLSFAEPCQVLVGVMGDRCTPLEKSPPRGRDACPGWNAAWGVIAPLANLYALLSNLGQNSAVKKWPLPTSRDPNVMTPLPGPPPFSRPVTSRQGPWFGTIAALVVLLFVIGGAASNADTTGSTTSSSPIGTCLDFDGATVSCSDSASYWRPVSRGPDYSTRPAAFTDPATNRIYCAGRN